MSEVYVHGLAYALGDQAISLADTVQAGRTISDLTTLREAGFHQHHVAADGTDAYMLGLRAAQALGEQPGIDLARTGAILYATCLTCNGNRGSEAEFRTTRDVKHLMDYPASHLQADLDLPDAAVIGLNQQACTSMLGSLRMARALLLAEPEMEGVLCVSADRFPAGAIYEQAYNLISDGAAACWVGREPRGYRLVATHALTNGALAQATDDETVGSYFGYTHRLVTELLRKADMRADDLDWVVPQNTHVKTWEVLSRLLRIPLERVYFDSIGEVAHIISSDNVVNLLKLENSGRIQSGQRLLLLMAGFGLNWQGTILEKR
ncbi:MAG: 3-oxoacyl-[acyl-carrier-protein] synthase III C-terminal domain-containing protein [Candidatus Sericytochromatia bacterium]|nr:3-oxoacyl-[acyl-carrier-protein] synthase III C-terminal domain-containing protein [Candidatus Sericytochromatia bacterium]